MLKHRRPLPSFPFALIALLAAGAIVVGACASAATLAPPSAGPASPPVASRTPIPTPAGSPGTPPPTAPGSSPTAGPTTGEIAHPTDATAVVFRYESGGGFVRPDFLAVQVPAFTLYGDGTVLYRSINQEQPVQGPADPLRFPPLLVAKMSEEQIQAFLADALGSGLAVARAEYANQRVSDAPTTIFTIDANGTQKRVTIYALGMDDGTNPDGPLLGKIAALAERLAAFDQEVTAGRATAVGAFRPGRFRATLVEGAAGNLPPIAWPWSGFGPDAFRDPPADSLNPLPYRVISGADAGQLGIPNIEGGVSGITVKAGSTTYGLGLRPMLPDERD